jgi:hypothetical protein
MAKFHVEYKKNKVFYDATVQFILGEADAGNRQDVLDKYITAF